jgi:ribulose-5-phosphate 4-epimerase/fuculose-1-phosphate aldolase
MTNSETDGRSWRYALTGKARTPELGELAAELHDALDREGFGETADPKDADLVINLIDPDDPKPFRRKSRGTFVAALHEQLSLPSDMLALNYPLLVRALANNVLCYVPDEGVWFVTPERGNYRVWTDGGTRELGEAVIRRLVPLARSRLVIDNEFRTDLEPELWDGDEVTEQVHRAGARLGALDLLPSPFPINDLLTERDLRHVMRLYGLGGLSYGNLSARKDERRFWMSASGVDKTKLEVPGRDILLVSDYDVENGRIVLSVPPDVQPRRVSVDAIEHWMIYQAHPGIGAILHIHAWVDGVAGTEINYPCGTEELAESVSDLLAAEPEPDHAVIGLRNHGITATGQSLDEILDRITPRLIRQVPMT